MTTSRRFRWCIQGALALCLLAGALLWYSRYQDVGLEVNAGLGRERIQAAVIRGLDFLTKRQLETGEFPTYSWIPGQKEKKYLSSPGTASSILYTLKFVDGGEVGRQLRERAIEFIMSRREPPGVWNHQIGTDPDVDDTAVAWAALYMHGIPVEPEALKALKDNRTKTGLFKTWFPGHRFPEGHPDLVLSPGVNLNVLLLFALVGQPLPEVCRYAITYTKSQEYKNGEVYYPPLVYARILSRAYADGGADCLAEAIPEIRSYVLAQQRPEGGWGDDLKTAMAVLVLLNTGEREAAVSRGIKVILDRQDQDGGWDTSPIFYSANPPLRYYGSPSITTGFCLEALGKYLKR